MRTHELIVGWMHVVAGAFVFVCIATLWILATQLAVVFAGSFVPALVALFGMPIAIALLAVSGLEVAAGAALLRGKAWPRMVLVCIGVLQIAVFPIGTALAVFTFWVLLFSPQQLQTVPVVPQR